MSVRKDLGMVTAYAYAVSKGYAGTEEEFATLMASYTDVGQAAVDAALAAKASEDAAKASETAAEASETAAATSAGTATTAAQTASQATQIATTKASEATTAASTATTKAAEAAQSATAAANSATTAGASATAAQAAQTAAEAAQTAAETAQGAAEDAAESVSASAAQIDQNTEDISLVKSHLDAISVEDTASGAIATFADGSDGVPVESLTVSIEPIQDLHGQANPYPAGGGKNLFQTTAESKTEAGVTWTVNADGSVSVSGTATGYTSLVLGIMPVDSSLGVITISGIASASNITWGNLSLYDSNGDLVYTISGGSSQASFTVDLASYPTATQLRVMVKRNSDAAVSGVIKPQVEKSSSATTFAPYSNICPITGRSAVRVTRTGKNFANITSDSIRKPSWYTGNWLGVSVNDNGGITQTRGYINSGAGGFTTHLKAGKTYTFSCECPWNYSAFFNFLSWNGENRSTLINGVVQNPSPGSRIAVTFTVPPDSIECSFRPTVNRETDSGETYDFNRIQIEPGLAATAYEAAQIQTVTIPLGQTVYGGTVDVTTGEMVVDKVIVTFDETKQYTAYGATIVCSTRLSNPGNFDRMSEIVCNYQNGGLVGCKFANNSADTIQWTNATNVFNVADADEFKALMGTYKESGNPMTVVYPIATPLTIQLSAQTLTTLKGVNNIWSDGGDVAVDYVADTKLFIEQLTEPDADMVADANITSGQYFMVGNGLYLATANIANGSAIVPGTNCTRTNLAAALNAINS